MLISLKQLNEGMNWPVDETNEERQEQLEFYKRIFNGKIDNDITPHFDRVSKVTGNFMDVVSFETRMNYQKKVSIKTVDLLLGETPTVAVKTQTDNDALNDALEDIGFWNIMYECMIDVSRYGNGVLKVYKDTNGKANLSVIPTNFWYPVVDPTNIKEITSHVIAHQYDIEKDSYLKIEIHYKGLYETRLHRLSKTNSYSASNTLKIGELISSYETYTGLTDFAIVPISNITSSDNLYGISDYEDINGVISEIEVRLGQVSKILDKHADPSMQLPSDCIETDDETGMSRIKLGDAFIINSKDSVEPKYITWDGQLEANFNHIKLLFEQLAILSELGSLFIGNGLEKLGNISGVALRKLAFSALAKINRLQMRSRSAIVKSIKLMSQLGLDGVPDLTKERITVRFGDGLPVEWSDLIEQIAMAVQANVMSVEAAIELLNDNASSAQIELELERINKQMKLSAELKQPQVKGIDTNV